MITTPTEEFTEFPKIYRLSREVIITEKIDGTNAQIFIKELDGHAAHDALFQCGGLALYAGSRNRWITPHADNYGFAKWALAHGEELLSLGPGRHFGEWWGQGIQRGYGLKEKRFSMFNVIRYCEHDHVPEPIPSNDPKAEPKFQTPLPPCVSLVPVLYRGLFDTGEVVFALDKLQIHGSVAAPGFMHPEGVVVYHTAGNVAFKKTLEKDEVPKSLARG